MILERALWLMEKRRNNEQRMDTMFAPVYDEQWGAMIDETHRTMLERFLSECPAAPKVLDAACGTGKYWSILRDNRVVITGVDQSRQMLAKAQLKYPDVLAAHLGLQEIRYLPAESFEGVICIDAIENVFPEDWPLVLANFRHVLRSAKPLYLTVEMEAEDVLAEAYESGRMEGMPLVPGEVATSGGYHYYPAEYQVRAWLAFAGFRMIDVAEGDGYKHYICRAA